MFMHVGSIVTTLKMLFKNLMTVTLSWINRLLLLKSRIAISRCSKEKRRVHIVWTKLDERAGTRSDE